MITKEDWKRVYNIVYKIFPPSPKTPMKIIYKKNKNRRVFTNIDDFITFLCIQPDTSINANIEYIITDDKEYNEIVEFIKKMDEI